MNRMQFTIRSICSRNTFVSLFCWINFTKPAFNALSLFLFQMKSGITNRFKNYGCLLNKMNISLIESLMSNFAAIAKHDTPING